MIGINYNLRFPASSSDVRKVSDLPSVRRKTPGLLATNKRDQSVSILDLKTGKELACLPTKRKVLHGVVISPDDAYAFVTVEGVGSEPGTVEIIDLKALKTAATVDVGQEAAGVDFFKTEPSR